MTFESIYLITGSESYQPFEYFCNSCGQLRLALKEISKCGNCGSHNIIKGEVNSLDKDSLKNNFRKREVQL